MAVNNDLLKTKKRKRGKIGGMGRKKEGGNEGS